MRNKELWRKAKKAVAILKETGGVTLEKGKEPRELDQRDKVLPLVEEITGTWDDGHTYSRLQRDADWERVRPVINALVRLLKIWEETERTYEDAYYAMFKSSASAQWEAARKALADLGVIDAE